MKKNKKLNLNKSKGVRNTSKMVKKTKTSKTKKINPMFIPTVNDRKLTWNQAKKKYPGLKARGDYDMDGFYNSKDCRPFDPTRDGILQRIAGIATGGRKGQTKEQYSLERAEKKAIKKLDRQDRRIPKEAKRKRTIARLDREIDAAETNQGLKKYNKKLDRRDRGFGTKKGMKGEMSAVDKREFAKQYPDSESVVEAQNKAIKDAKKKGVDRRREQRKIKSGSQYITLEDGSRQYYAAQPKRVFGSEKQAVLQEVEKNIEKQNAKQYIKADKAVTRARTEKAYDRQKKVKQAKENTGKALMAYATVGEKKRPVWKKDKYGNIVKTWHTRGGIQEVAKAIKNPSVLKDTRLQSGSRIYRFPGGATVRSVKQRRSSQRQTSLGRTSGRVGRPPGTLKIRINPFTGKPVKMPAKEYYKLLRQYRNRNEVVANNVDRQQVAQLAKRGIPPEQAKQIVDARQLQSAVPERTVQTVPEYQPQQVVQPQAYQQEYERIQRLEPWARRTATIQLQRRMQVDQRLQNGGVTRNASPNVVREEVSLMTGRPTMTGEFQKTERWTQ